MQVYLGTFHTDSPNWQRLRAGTTLLITVISITFSTVPFGRLRFAMALRDALHLFLLNFLGQPLSCHVGLVLLEGLIWCYHLQVTPNPTESLRRQARCMQRSKAWALSWFYLHGILQAPVFQSPHNQQNMSKSFKINPWKLMNNEDHPPTLWEEVCFMPRCWGLGHKGRCQGQTESQPSQIPAASLLPVHDY